MARVSLCILLLVAVAAAQDGTDRAAAAQVTDPSPAPPADPVLLVTFSPQPASAYKDATGAKLPKDRTLGAAQLCNHGAVEASVDAGVVDQAAQTKLATVSALLAPAALRGSRRRNPLALAVKTAEGASLIGNVLIAGGTIAAGPAVQAALAIAALASHSLASELNAEFPQAELSGLFLSGTLKLAPGACESRLFFVNGKAKWEPFAVQIR